MTRKLALAVLFYAVWAGASAETAPAVSTHAAPIPLPKIEHSAFRPGEKFVFDIKYEFINAGEATLEISSGIPINGRPTLGFSSVAKSNKFVDAFFKVRDYNASRIDEESLATLSFHQNLREGNYRVIRNTTIDYQTGKYAFEKTYKGKTTQREGAINQPVSDILSTFFYTRTLPLEPGKEYFFVVFSDDQIYRLKVVVDAKVEKIRVEAGKFECIRVHPFVVGDAIFRASDGKITIWMTNDERKMPVLIRSKVAVGAFDAELSEYQPATK